MCLVTCLVAVFGFISKVRVQPKVAQRSSAVRWLPSKPQLLDWQRQQCGDLSEKAWSNIFTNSMTGGEYLSSNLGDQIGDSA